MSLRNLCVCTHRTGDRALTPGVTIRQADEGDNLRSHMISQQEKALPLGQKSSVENQGRTQHSLPAWAQGMMVPCSHSRSGCLWLRAGWAGLEVEDLTPKPCL